MSAVERVAAVFTRPVRLWLYGIGVAAFGVLFVYGLVNVEQTAAWLLLIGSALGVAETGMAALNARKPQPPAPLIERHFGDQ